MKKMLIMMSSMKIGGVEKSLLSLLSTIPNDKYDITLLLLEKKGGFLEFVPNWVKIEEVNWFKKIKPIIMEPPKNTVLNFITNKEYVKIPRFIYFYYKSKKLEDRHLYYKHILENIPEDSTKYDVAISYQGPTDIIDYYIAEKTTAKKKISWIHFDISKHEINQKLHTRLFYSFDKIFIVSKEAKKKLVEKIPSVEKKCEVFLNIISPDLIAGMAKQSIEFDRSFSGLKIVTIGRLSKEKGQDIAIKVLARLRNNGYNVRWYCIGEGRARKEYEELIRKYKLIDHFFLIGETQNPYPYLEQADIYVQTSRHEGYCLTLAEAKCLCKPIVTTDFTGAHEQIIDEHNGIISSFDEEEFYLKLLNLIENPMKIEKLSKNLLNSGVNTTSEVNKLFSFVN